MSEYKIIFAGPGGAGKTTAIATLSDKPPVSTNLPASEVACAKKADDRVVMDYGVMSLDGHEAIHLYSTPAQQQLDVMRSVLSRNGIGLVLLLDNTGREPLNDMAFYLESFNAYVNETAVAVGVTRTDLAPLLTMDAYNQKLKELGYQGAVLEVDARSYNDMSTLVQALLFSIDPGLEYSA